MNDADFLNKTIIDYKSKTFADKCCYRNLFEQKNLCLGWVRIIRRFSTLVLMWLTCYLYALYYMQIEYCRVDGGEGAAARSSRAGGH